MSKGEEHVVVVYELVDAKGATVSVHCGFDTDLPNIQVPEGLTLVRKDTQSTTAAVREVNHVIPRMEEYPSVGDQLDVLWKMFEANPALMTPEAKSMLDRIKATKAAYVKGTTYVTSLNNPEGKVYVPKE